MKKLKNGKSILVEESIIDGPTGISFQILFKRVDKTIVKYSGRQNEDKSFTYIIIKDGDKQSTSLSENRS